MDKTIDTLRKLRRLQRTTEEQVARLRAEAEQNERTAAEPAPPAWDERAAAVELARAKATDVIDGTRTAAKVRTSQDRARAAAESALAEHRGRVEAARRRVREISTEILDATAMLEAADREIRALLAEVGRERIDDAKAAVYARMNDLVIALADWRAMAALSNEDAADPVQRGPRIGFAITLPVCESSDRAEGLIAPFVGWNAVTIDNFAGSRIVAERYEALRAELMEG